MQIQIASDLHLDINNDITSILKQGSIPREILNSDQKQDTVLILCGDICDPLYWQQLFEILSPLWKHIIIVPGNHEFYGYYISDTFELMRSSILDFSNIHLLDQEDFTIEDITFLGATGWAPTDLLLGIDRYVNDFTWIKDFRGNVHRCQELHNQFLEWVKGKLDTLKDIKTVLITHFGQYSVPQPIKFIGNPFNRYFVTGSLDYMENNPELIIFGHTHSSTRRLTDKIPIICNPRGYRFENWNYDSNLVIPI